MKKMKAPNYYVNGKIEEIGQFQEARKILQELGIYQTLGNFGVYNSKKTERIFTEIEVFIKDGYEFRIIESEVMSFSFDSMRVSKPYIQKECWFQPI